MAKCLQAFVFSFSLDDYTLEIPEYSISLKVMQVLWLKFMTPITIYSN